MVRPAVILPPEPDNRWQLAKQMGVNQAVIHPLEVGSGQTNWSYGELLQLKNWFEDANLEIAVIEGSVPLTDRIRLGKQGRDNDIENFKQFVRDCGALDIPVIAYDWMAKVRWARTEAHVPARGNSLVTRYTDENMNRGDKSPTSDVSRETIWEALNYFLQEVLPIAEEAGVKLALHPDDPPLESLQGVPRIINSPEAYERVLNCYNSENNGITFCQGNFAAMNVDIPQTIRRFGDRINFIHFRDVKGDARHFVETWHDNGPTDMLAALQAYQDAVDDDVPIRPDHVPTMAGENNSNPGYHMKGRLFVIGYMKGLLEQTQQRDTSQHT